MNANTTVQRGGRRFMQWLGAATILAFFAGSALAATGITNTKHNLSSSGPGNKFSGTDQICVFCHTPHGSDGDNTHPPLWNRAMGTATYQTYDSLGTSTLNGQVLAVGSVSLACLSCHDGTQAMNNVINGPGSGLNPTSWSGGTWSVGGAVMGGGVTSGALTGLVNLGGDLKDDHPIGVQYCGGGITATAGGAVNGTCVNTEFIGPGGSTTTSDGRTAALDGALINSKQAFWVDVDQAAGRGKGDIRLYSRTFTAGAGPSVECGSCHDPHVESLGNNNVAFMRVTATGSKICLSCHVK